MKIIRNLAIAIFLMSIALIFIGYNAYSNGITPVDENSTEAIVVEIASGSSASSIGDTLYEKGLIKSTLFFRIYLKLNSGISLQAGTYELSKSMNIEDIVNKLNEGDIINPDAISITFKEGINMRGIAAVISENTNNSESDVFNLLNDEEYLDSIINDYWFITDDIKDDDIYYSLEGYLFPDTYIYEDKDVCVSTIFLKMLNEMENVLDKYKSKIEASDLSVHELLTLASVVEKEGVNEDDRKIISGVFYNRLKDNWSLGSDVTTCYGLGLELYECKLGKTELAIPNAYNTREPYHQGELPIGPISIPSEESIDAAINPDDTDYYFFVADKNMNIYFGITNNDHNANIQMIKESGNWLTY